jgi:hypothetical protein
MLYRPRITGIYDGLPIYQGYSGVSGVYITCPRAVFLGISSPVGDFNGLIKKASGGV